MGDLREGAQVFIGDEIVYGSDLTLGDRVADELSGLGLGRSGALACLGVSEGRLTAAFSLENLRLLGALGPQDRGLPVAFRGQYFSALVALGLHLPAHRSGTVCRRQGVLDLPGVDIRAPGDHSASDPRRRRWLFSSGLSEGRAGT